MKNETVDSLLEAFDTGKCSGSSQSNSLKSKLYCYFTAVSSLCYIYVLQDLLYSHDNTYHRSIGRAPATNKKNDLILNFTPENVTAF